MADDKFYRCSACSCSFDYRALICNKEIGDAFFEEKFCRMGRSTTEDMRAEEGQMVALVAILCPKCQSRTISAAIAFDVCFEVDPGGHLADLLDRQYVVLRPGSETKELSTGSSLREEKAEQEEFERQQYQDWLNSERVPVVAGLSISELCGVYFSGSQPVDPRTAVLRAISCAATHVQVAMFIFTDSEIARALADAAHRGVIVTVMVDGSGDERLSHWVVRALGQERVQLDRVSGRAMAGDRPGLMHHKVLIVDRRLVAFGSYNYSLAARDQNYEDVTITEDRAVVDAWWTHLAAIRQRYRVVDPHAAEEAQHAGRGRAAGPPPP